MLEKLATLLGEELSKQVTEKLGTVELAVFNDGTVVPAEKHEKLKADNKALEGKYQTDISEFTKKLEDASKSTDDIVKLKESLETLRQENNEIVSKYDEETKNIKMDSAIDLALMKANVDEKYIPLLKTQIKRENLTIDGENIIGLTDSIEGLKGTYDKMFGEVKKTGVQPPSDQNTAPVGKKAQLIEAYEKAEKSKDARTMMSLQTQISNLKE